MSIALTLFLYIEYPSRLSGNVWVSIKEVTLRLAQLVLGWVTMFRVQLPVQDNLSQYITSHPGQLSLAIPPWVGTVSTSDSYGHH